MARLTDHNHEARKQRFARLASLDWPLHEIRNAMGLTSGEASRVWQDIKADLGRQAQ